MTTDGPVAPDVQAMPGSVLLACVLASVTGYVDAVGASQVAGVFVSFMSGNTTSTGIALGTLDEGRLVHVGMVIPLFLAGVVGGALLLRPGLQRRVLVLLLADLLLAVSLVEGLVGRSPASTTSWSSELLVLAPLTLAMGLVNTTVRHVGPASVGLGYVTGSLVSLGEGLAELVTVRTPAAVRTVCLYAAVWVCFFGGAALGAAVASQVPVWALAVPIAVLAAVLVGLRRSSRPSARGPRPRSA